MNPADSVLRRLFNEAEEIADPAARAAFLDSACQGDGALRARVERLLALQSQAGKFLGGATGAADAGPFPDTMGRRVGRYRLVDRIGEGGYGIVYLAEQEEPVRRRVALKVIKLGMDTRAVVARFEAERQALALMDHPNIARAYDAGATDEGRPYFVMELVSGMPITEYCHRNQLNVRQRLELFCEVCQGIQHAHQKGIIHRDLKPSNILVTEDDGRAVPKVIDFGIAKATDPASSCIQVTAGQDFIGTPAYMSPEQVQAGCRDIDTRSDIYSLGVILYELLTGEPPFDPRELMQAGVVEMSRIIREVEPQRLSTRIGRGRAGAWARKPASTPGQNLDDSPRRWPRSLHGDLDWIALKCLEKDRARRYPTANALAADVRRHLENEPVQARPPSAVYRLQKVAQRHRLAVSAAAVVVLVLLGAVVVSSRLAVRARRAEEDAKQQAAAERAVRDRAETISRILLNVVGNNRIPDDSRATMAAGLREEVRRFQSEPPGDPMRAEVAYTAGRVFLQFAMYQDAAPLLEEYRDYCAARFGPDDRRTLKVMGLLSTALWYQERLPEAIALQEELVRRRRQLFGVGDASTQIDIRWLGEFHAKAGKWNEAIPLLREAVDLGGGVPAPDTESAMATLAESYQAVGRHEEAISLRQALLTYHLDRPKPEEGWVVRALENLASACLTAGRMDEAARHWGEASARNRHDRIRDLRLGGLLVWFGRTNEHGAMTARLLRSTADTDSAGDANCVAKLASLGRLADPDAHRAALGLARRAVTLGRKDSLLPWFQLSLGMTQHRLGDFAAAAEALLAAEKGAEGSSPGHRPYIQATARFFRVMGLCQQGREPEARQLFAETSAEMKPVPGDAQGLLAADINQDDVILWLAWREARALLAETLPRP